MKTWMWWALGIGVVAGVGIGVWKFRAASTESSFYDRIQMLATRLYNSPTAGAGVLAQELASLQSGWQARGGSPSASELVRLAELETDFAALSAQALQS